MHHACSCIRGMTGKDNDKNRTCNYCAKTEFFFDKVPSICRRRSGIRRKSRPVLRHGIEIIPWFRIFPVVAMPIRATYQCGRGVFQQHRARARCNGSIFHAGICTVSSTRGRLPRGGSKIRWSQDHVDGFALVYVVDRLALHQ